MQEGVRDARTAVRVSVAAFGVRIFGDDRIGFTLAAPPQELDLIGGQHVADDNEAVPVEDTDGRIDFLGAQDLEARHAVVGLQVASQCCNVHGHAGRASRNFNGM